MRTILLGLTGPRSSRRLALLAAVFSLPVAILAAPAAVAGPGPSSVPIAARAAVYPPGCTWSATQLPLPAGWTSGSVSAGDGRSALAGFGVDSQFPGTNRPLLWRAGAVTELPAPADSSARAVDVNSSGVVVADAHSDTGDQPYLWQDGRIRLLATGTYSTVLAEAISDSGLIAGTAFDDAGVHAVFWRASRPGVIHDLGVTGDGVVLTDVTATGRLVGWLDRNTGEAVTGRVATGLRALPLLDPALPSRALAAAGAYTVGFNGFTDGAGAVSGYSVRWRGNTPTALPTGAFPLAVNAAGVAAGSDADHSAAVWADGRSWVLPDPPGTTHRRSSAREVNADGAVAGDIVRATDGSSVPVIWRCA